MELARPCPALEEFVARSHLSVRGILDLQPVGARAVRMVATARELGDDALEVVRTRDLEEIPPPPRDVVHGTAAASALTGSVAVTVASARRAATLAGPRRPQR